MLPAPSEASIAAAARLVAMASAVRDAASLDAALAACADLLDRAVGEAVDGGDGAIERARALLDLAATLPATLVATLPPRAPGSLAERTAAAVRTLVAAAAAAAAALADPPSRAVAADLAARVDAVAEAASEEAARVLGPAAAASLDEVARLAAAALRARAADLPGLVRVTTTRSMPAAALAWHLYGDPDRAGELIEMNPTGTSLFMPVEIVAPAR